MSRIRAMADRPHLVSDSVEYVIPGRTLSGARADVLAALDEMIQGLLYLRHQISTAPAAAAPSPRRRFRLVKSVPAMLLALGVTLFGFQQFGDTTAFFNGDDDTQVVASFGVGFAC